MEARQIYKTVFIFHDEDNYFELVRFDNRRLGIIKNGRLASTWDECEEAGCIHAYADLIGFTRHTPVNARELN